MDMDSSIMSSSSGKEEGYLTLAANANTEFHRKGKEEIDS
jgi:hypothetical protein